MVSIGVIKINNRSMGLKKRHECGRSVFPEITSWCEDFYLKCQTTAQAMKLKFGLNKVGKRTLCDLKARIHFSSHYLTNVVYHIVSLRQPSVPHYVSKFVNSVWLQLIGIC